MPDSSSTQAIGAVLGIFFGQKPAHGAVFDPKKGGASPGADPAAKKHGD
jgi:hypothetical protein